MNTFDIVIAVLIAFFIIRGVFRGFVKEFFSIVGVFVGFLGAMRYYERLAALITGEIINPAYLPIVAFLVIFAVVYFIISVSGVIIKYLLKITLLGWVDRILGAISGGLKGGLISAVFLLVLITFLPAGSPLVTRSHLAPHLLSTIEKMALVLPKEMHRRYNGNIKAVKKGLRGHR